MHEPAQGVCDGTNSPGRQGVVWRELWWVRCPRNTCRWATKKNPFTSLKICAVVFAILLHATQNRYLELADFSLQFHPWQITAVKFSRWTKAGTCPEKLVQYVPERNTFTFSPKCVWTHCFLFRLHDLVKLISVRLLVHIWAPAPNFFSTRTGVNNFNSLEQTWI